MFILIFFLVIGISQFISNKMIHLSDDSEDAYTFTKKDSLTIAILFIVGIVLQIVSDKLLNQFYWIAAGVYLFSSIIIMFVLLQVRKKQILQQREQLQQIYEILQKLVDKKGEGLDFNNVPFTLTYKYGNVQQIRVMVEPTQFSSDPEKQVMPFIPQLNAFLPTYQWMYELHLDQRYIDFIGEDKPPTLARWPGSWLRHFRYMPVGLSGKGEIAYQPDSIPKSDYGVSQFLDEHGNPVNTDKTLPTQPQGLVCGAPLGLDTVIPTTKGYKTIETITIGDEVFDISNKPVKVLGKSDVNYSPDKVYRLNFKNKEREISIISDSIHKFPVWKNMRVTQPKNSGIVITTIRERVEVTAEDLKVNDNIVANNKKYCKLIKKEEIEKQPVQCILVDSDEHLFLITDKFHVHEDWRGGNSYPHDAIYTRNTGGGKAIWVEQEIEG